MKRTNRKTKNRSVKPDAIKSDRLCTPHRKTRPVLIIAIFAAAVLIVALVVLLNIKVREQRSYSPGDIEYARARVLEITSEDLSWEKRIGLYRGEQDFTAKILSGSHAGEIVVVKNGLMPVYNVHVKEGMTVVLRVYDGYDGIRADVYSYYRFPYYLAVLAVFLGVMVLIGRKKGVKSALGLVFTVLCILYVLLPMLFLGFSPVLAAVVTGVITSLISLSLLSGLSRKTLAAILGTIIGVAVAGGAAYIVGRLAHITIYNSEEADYVLMYVQDTQLKGQGILFAGIIIAALGAVMDVAMSIASAIWEMSSIDRNMQSSRLFASGMNVGRDMIATMSNTLILAFAGSSMNVAVILYFNNLSFIQLINSDFLGVEILQAVSGTLGVLGAIPITAYISAALFKRVNS